MQINITGRHIEIPDPIKQYIVEKLSKLSKYGQKIEEARVIFSLERFNHIAEITLNGKRFRITSAEKEEGLRNAFDKSLANMEKQIKRFYAKVKDHKAKRFFEALRSFSLRRKEAKPQAPRIIKNETAETKPMSCEEAALELDLFGRDFIVFRNANTDNINVIYKRKDGNYGLIEP